jgi:hypothetical protein
MLFVVAVQIAPVLGDAGSLPVYPHRINSWYQGHYDNKATTAQLEAVLKQGFVTFLDTSDSRSVVTDWYKARLPGYSEHTVSAVTAFSGDGGLVEILPYKGKIRVALMPK